MDLGELGVVGVVTFSSLSSGVLEGGTGALGLSMVTETWIESRLGEGKGRADLTLRGMGDSLGLIIIALMLRVTFSPGDDGLAVFSLSGTGVAGGLGIRFSGTRVAAVACICCGIGVVGGVGVLITNACDDVASRPGVLLSLADILSTLTTTGLICLAELSDFAVWGILTTDRADWHGV